MLKCRFGIFGWKIVNDMRVCQKAAGCGAGIYLRFRGDVSSRLLEIQKLLRSQLPACQVAKRYVNPHTVLSLCPPCDFHPKATIDSELLSKKYLSKVLNRLLVALGRSWQLLIDLK